MTEFHQRVCVLAAMLISVLGLAEIALGQQFDPNNGAPPPSRSGPRYGDLWQQPSQQFQQNGPRRLPPVRPPERMAAAKKRVGPAKQRQNIPRARAPFPQLTFEQQRSLDRVLADYEKHGQKVKTFEAALTRFEFDGVFGPPNKHKTLGKGKIKFAKPDKALFLISEMKIYDRRTGGYKTAPKAQGLEHWVFTGKKIIRKNYQTRTVEEYILPAEMQGKGIVRGPLPFLFGAKAAELKQRYFMRIITPPNLRDQVWIEVFPRFQQDAAEYRRVEVILRTSDFLPTAIQVHRPNGKDRTVYMFHQIEVNKPPPRFFPKDNYKIPTPFGWKRIVEKPPARTVRRTPGQPAPRRTPGPPAGHIVPPPRSGQSPLRR